MKKVMISLLIISICMSSLLFPLGVFAGGGKDEDAFAGERIVEFRTDKSDLDNFIDGGRSTFDLIIRAYKPTWLSAVIYAENRDVIVSLSFSFESFEDYKEKISALLLADTGMIKTNFEGLVLIEDYTPFDLLNFVRSPLTELDCFNEKALNEIFDLTLNSLTLDGEAYEFSDEAIVIRPKTYSETVYEKVSVNTVGHNNGTFTRTIEVLPTTDFRDVASRFASVGTVSEDGSTISVTFDAANYGELTESTLLCLFVASYISTFEYATDNGTIGVEFSEFWDTSAFLSEDGSFSYSFSCPDYFQNISADDGVEVEGNTVSCENFATVNFYYERVFRITDICVITDFSNEFGKISRKIDLKAPLDVAALVHDEIMAQLGTKLTDGTTLTVYDEDNFRVYSFTFSSWFEKDIVEFSNLVFNDNAIFDIKMAWLPFGNSSLYDRIVTGDLLDGVVITDSVSYKFILPKNSRVLSSEKLGIETGKPENGTVEFEILSATNINIEFQRFYAVKAIVYGVIFLVIATVIIVAAVLISKAVKKRKAPTENPEHDDASSTPSSDTPKEESAAEPLEKSSSSGKEASDTENCQNNTEETAISQSGPSPSEQEEE